MMEARGSGRRIGYIASGPEPDRRFFNGRKIYYAQSGLHLAQFHDLDASHSDQEIEKLLACDAIHLAGGQTGPFLNRLRRSRMLGLLRDWALSGGILVGASAGAILTTPTIATDALFSDRQPEETEDGAALNLVPFEFFPHLGGKPSYLLDLLRYSRNTPRPIVACRDGDGIVVTRGMIECVGQPVWIAAGAVRKASEITPAGFSIRPAAE